MTVGTLEKTKLAKTGAEYLALIASDADWFVRDANGLKAIRDGGGPLKKLTENDFNAFVASLEFKRGGVAHGTYRPLTSALSITEIFQVFEMFGFDRDYTLRILEASCSHSGTCDFSFWSFCASNCHPHTKEQ